MTPSPGPAELDQHAVQLVWPAALPGTPDPGLPGEDVQVRYATGDLATAGPADWLPLVGWTRCTTERWGRPVGRTP